MTNWCDVNNMANWSNREIAYYYNTESISIYALADSTKLTVDELMLILARDMGFRAYCNGEDSIDNPYIYESALYDQWVDGWIDAGGEFL